MTYKLSEVASAAGVDLPTLTRWIDRGYIKGPRSGSGHHRTFGVKDVDRVALIAELTRLGLPVSEAAKAASAFSDERSTCRPKGQLHAGGARTLLVVDRDGASVHRCSDRESFDDAMATLFADSRSAVVVNVTATLARVDAALDGNATPKPLAGAIYRDGRELKIS